MQTRRTLGTGVPEAAANPHITSGAACVVFLASEIERVAEALAVLSG